MEDRTLAEGLSIQEACQMVAPELGVSWHTARQWVQEARKTGRIMRAEEGIIAENARLRRENQELRDRELVEIARRIHAENYGVYGVWKMWHALKREGIDIGREQTRRIMKRAGVAGQRKGRNPITTVKGKLALILSNAISPQPVQVVGR